MSSIMELRAGARATYQGRYGVVADRYLSSAPDLGTYYVWHLVYDTPHRTHHVCGCCPGNTHRYQGVFTTAEHLTVVATL